MRRLTAVLVMSMPAVLLLSGCVVACPAIGHSNFVEVTTLDAAVIELDCAEGCEGGVERLEPVGPVWTFDAPSRPEVITVVGRDADGTELVREQLALSWTVVDPGNRCGSSASADPVTLPR